MTDDTKNQEKIVTQLRELQRKTSMERGLQSSVEMAKLLYAFKKALVTEGFSSREAMQLTQDYFDTVMATQLGKAKE